MFKNKLDVNDIITKNKVRLVAKGYSQAKGISYKEAYALVAYLYAIQLHLAFALCLNFKLYHMNVRLSFLNGFIDEKVDVSQPSGFENHENPDYVFKLKQTLYGIKQSLRACYERLSRFLIKQGFNRDKVDIILFIRSKVKYILLIQIYIDDIIFGFTNKPLLRNLRALMQAEFKMSLMGELTYFLET